MARPQIKSKVDLEVPLSPCTNDESSSSSTRIRSRYLHRLGLVPQYNNIASHERQQTQLDYHSNRTDEVEIVELLKDDYGKEDETLTVHSPPIHSPCSLSHGKRRRTVVSFKPTVETRETFNRLDFSNRIKNSYWISKQESEELARINQLEFLTEKNDASAVLEEKDFIIIDGKLVHPSHLMAEFQQILAMWKDYPSS